MREESLLSLFSALQTALYRVTVFSFFSGEMVLREVVLR
jgi:hypothetical protein